MQLHRATSRDTAAEGAEGDSPRHQIQFHSLLSLPSNFEADAALYYVSSLVNQQTPSYTRIDARLGWRPTESIALSFAGQNLLGRHAEFAGRGTVLPSEQKRSAYGKATWRF
jgi:iron complex outermembrane receptor protein